METLGLILLIWCGVLTVFWAAVWRHVGVIAKNPPTVRDGLSRSEPSNGWPRMSIIVPVHNEQRVIEACAVSLLAQDYPNLEVILVLDRCTDATRELLTPYEHDPRLVIIENDHCPNDWAGKCNAARLGAGRASGEWLVFTDADTEFDPALSRAAVSMAIDRDSPLLSLLSSLTYQATHERVAQPVATMSLMRMFPLVRHSKRKPRPFANGQYMLFQRSWYEKLGGHAAVKDDLLEDLAFARLVHRHDAQTTVLLADGMLRCSMYDSLEAFQRGWKRIFIEACRRKTMRLRKRALGLFVLGIASPLAQVAAIGAAVLMENRPLQLAILITAIGSVLVQTASLVRIYQLNGAPRWAVMAYPIGCWIVARLMADAARDLTHRRPVVWGGKQYVLEPR